MSYLLDTVDDYLDNSPDPEDEAIDLLNHLHDRFGWSDDESDTLLDN